MTSGVLLCDADDCLFPSETVAFQAACGIVNDLLADLGSDRRFAPEELRRKAAGRSFRAIATDLAAEHDVRLPDADLERRVFDEQRAVTARLASCLAPDPDVLGPLRQLGRRHRLVLVSSSALTRLDVCLRATGLAELFPAHLRFSAADSLPAPTSKPDPAVYALAVSRVGATGGPVLAVEDSVSGVRSAVGAGVPVVGNLQFVPPEERDERSRQLHAAGADAVLDGWRELAEVHVSRSSP